MKNGKEVVIKGLREKLSLDYSELVRLSEADKDKLIMLLAKENEKLTALVYKDQLTGLHNRRGLSKQIDRSISNDESFAVVLGDIDCFKFINDLYGHPVGDKVLSEIGKIFRESIRENDVAVRYGGDEFQLILRDCTIEDAYIKVESIRDKVEKRVSVSAGIEDIVTMSFGISFCDQENINYKEALQQADDALYESKNNTKNAVNVFTRKLKL